MHKRNLRPDRTSSLSTRAQFTLQCQFIESVTHSVLHQSMEKSRCMRWQSKQWRLNTIVQATGNKIIGNSTFSNAYCDFTNNTARQDAKCAGTGTNTKKTQKTLQVLFRSTSAQDTEKEPYTVICRTRLGHRLCTTCGTSCSRCVAISSMYSCPHRAVTFPKNKMTLKCTSEDLAVNRLRWKLTHLILRVICYAWLKRSNYCSRGRRPSMTR